VRTKGNFRRGTLINNVKLFAYFNIDHPLVAWEVAIGRIKSSCDDNIDDFAVSLWQYNLLYKYAKNGMNKKLINELKLEAIRQKKYPHCISRLKGVYFFESERDAYIALDRWGMSEKKKYISEVCFSANNITKVDSEWITSCLLSENDSWMELYWNGAIYGERPLVEILASGIGVVQNYELRHLAFRKIMEEWPLSTPLLSMACCAFAEKKVETIAQVKPVLTKKGDMIVGSYFVYMDDLKKRENEIMEALELSKGKNEVPPMIVPNDGVSFFKLLDLGDYSFQLNFNGASALFDIIHSS